MPRTRTRSLSIAVSIAAIALLLGAASAAAATIPITGGEVDWGIKQSFREYVKGPGAKGQIEISGGATEEADGAFRFPVESGTYDLTTHQVEVQGTGTVHFTGHVSGGVPLLDLTFSNPRVVVGKSSVVYLDVLDKSFGANNSYPNTEFALLDPSTVKPVSADEAVTLTDIPAELTAAGAQGFAGFYEEGDELDPVRLVASYAPKAQPEQPKKEEPKPADPAPPGPVPVLTMPTLKSTGGPAKLRGGGSATIATIDCASTEPCTVQAPKNVKFKVGGRSFGAKVLAPKWVLAGKSGKVAVKVPKPALEELGGGMLKISVKLVLGTGTQSTTKVVKATLKSESGGRH
jgi:Htaa